MKMAGFLLAGLALALVCVALAGSASAADIDLRFEREPASPFCPAWDGSPSRAVEWNLTLRMNGTNTSTATTRTFVYINDSNIPARTDGWSFLLVAGAPNAPPEAFDGSRSLTQSYGDGAYPPIVQGQTMELALYGQARPGGATPAAINVRLIPSIRSLNQDWRFNVTAVTDRTAGPLVVRQVELCVHIPPDPWVSTGNFTYGTDPLGGPVYDIDAAHNSSVDVDFWLRNSGNTQDRYICTAQVTDPNWDWRLAQGFQFTNATHGRTNYVAPGANLSGANNRIRVQLWVPLQAHAGDVVAVSLYCRSEKAILLGLSPERDPPPTHTRVRVLPFYWVCADEVGPTLVEALPGDRVTFGFDVWNWGNVPDTAEAILTQWQQGWDTLIAPNAWTLSAIPETGYRGQGQLGVTVPAVSPPGTYEFRVNVSSANSARPPCPLTFQVQVGQVFLPAVTQPPAQEGLPGSDVAFSFTVSNQGNGPDELQVEFLVDGGSVWVVDTSVLHALVAPGEGLSRTAVVRIPADHGLAVAGVHNTTVLVTSVYARNKGLSVNASATLTVVVAQVVGCAVDPAATEAAVNAFPRTGDERVGSFILTVRNTGNLDDTLVLVVEKPEGLRATIAPDNMVLKLGEEKSTLATLRANVWLPGGIYYVTVRAVSHIDPQVRCEGTLRLTMAKVDAGIGDSVILRVQDPAHPDLVPPELAATNVTQLESNYIRFRVSVENHGDLPIEAGSLNVTVTDHLECPLPPQGAGQNPCGSRVLTVWTLPVTLQAGNLGSLTFLEFNYTMPEYICVDVVEVCESAPVPRPNAHRVTFSLSMADDSDPTNNEVAVPVNVMPAPGDGNPPSSANPVIPGLGAVEVAVALSAVALAARIRLRGP